MGWFKDTKTNYQKINQEIKRNTTWNKATEELGEESKGGPQFLTEQYGDPFDGEKVSQLTGSRGQDSESEEEQNREPGEPGTSMTAMDPSMVTSLSQPQLTHLPVMSPLLVAATTLGTIAGRPPTKLRRIEPQPLPGAEQQQQQQQQQPQQQQQLPEWENLQLRSGRNTTWYFICL